MNSPKLRDNILVDSILAADTAGMAPTDTVLSCSNRRTFLRAGLGAVLLGTVPQLIWAHAVVGQVQPPQSLPAINVTRHDGSSTTLQSLLLGKTTAVQLMFTGCSQSCPLQGALFAAVQERLPPQTHADVQLLSLSIDPLGDDAKALSTWLKQFGAGRSWSAAVPSVKDSERLRTALQQSTDSRDNHTGQVFLFNKKGLLVWRTENLPTIDMVVRQLVNISRV
jgi:protein SCO1/2